MPDPEAGWHFTQPRIQLGDVWTNLQEEGENPVSEPPEKVPGPNPNLSFPLDVARGQAQLHLLRKEIG